MSEFIIDTGKTRTEPIDYSWRNQPGAGCLGTIDCKECGCIMAAQGSHCFCMGIYTCPRCGYESKGWIHNIRGFKNGSLEGSGLSPMDFVDAMPVDAEGWAVPNSYTVSPIYDDPVDIDSETFEKIKTGFKAVDFAPTGVMIDLPSVSLAQLKELSQEDRAKVLRHFCRGCNRYLEEGEICYCEKY